jgi:hypothetical protein
MCTESWESPGGRRVTPGGVSAVVWHACERVGLKPVALTSFATLDEIGQVLRHERRDRTSIYAKVDRRS